MQQLAWTTARLHWTKHPRNADSMLWAHPRESRLVKCSSTNPSVTGTITLMTIPLENCIWVGWPPMREAVLHPRVNGFTGGNQKKHRFIFHSVAREVICGVFNGKDCSLSSHQRGLRCQHLQRAERGEVLTGT